MATGGNRVVSSGGGARRVFDARLRRTFTESGISSVSGLGHAADGPGTYEAARRATPDHRGQLLMRVHGIVAILGPDEYFDNWLIDSPGIDVDNLNNWLSFRVYKRDVLDQLQPARVAGLAAGDGDTIARKLPFDDDPTFDSTFKRIVSELCHYAWDTVYTVQFL